ncbi:MAG: hypothetical protein Q9217_007022 [Psora testacea]
MHDRSYMVPNNSKDTYVPLKDQKTQRHPVIPIFCCIIWVTICSYPKEQYQKSMHKFSNAESCMTGTSSTTTRDFVASNPSTKSPSSGTAAETKTPKLRKACDKCRAAKIRCGSSMPCSRCKDIGYECRYSYTERSGKPKGARSRKTAEQTSLTGQELERGQRPRSDDSLSEQSKLQHSSQPRTRDLFSGTVTTNGSARSALQTPQTVTMTLPNEEPDFLGIPTGFDLMTDFGNVLEPRSENVSSKSHQSFPTDLLLDIPMPDATTDFPAVKSARMAPSENGLGDMDSKTRTMFDLPDKSFHDLAFASENSPRNSAFLEGDHALAQDNFSLPLFADTNDGQLGENSAIHASSRSSEYTRSPSPSLSVGPGKISASNCCCVTRKAGILCKLSGLKDVSPSIRLDKGLAIINQAIVACQTFVDCPDCRKDAGRILLVLMILRLALDLLCQITSHLKSKGFPAADIGRVGDRADVALKFGTYEIGEDEEQLIIKMLIRRTMLRCAGALQSMQSLSQRSSSQNKDTRSASLQYGANEDHIFGLARTDREYFVTTIRQLQAVLPSLDPEQSDGV